MPRTLTLKPRQVKTPAGEIRWTVFVPGYLSETGKTQRRFFEKKNAAAVYCDQLWIRKRNQEAGVVISLSIAQQTEATKAYELLRPYPKLTLLGVIHEYLDAHRALLSADSPGSLGTVVSDHLERLEAQRASVPLRQLFEEFIEARASKSVGYCKRLGCTREKFEAALDDLVSELEPRKLETVLDRLPASSRNLEMRMLKAVFNFGIKRGYAATNPIDRLDFADHQRSPIEIIEPEIVERMLTGALENDPALVPFLVFGFFCGIRPNGELQKLDWASVHLSERTVVVERAVSKTGRRRFVDLSDNAKAWIDAYVARGGQASGPIVPFSYAILRAKRRANWRAAVGTTKDGGRALRRWVQTGMRHTFCSAWLAKHRDVNRLVLQSGHTSPTVMWNHYHLAIREAEAEKFWAITPPQLTESEKVVAFAG